jgi:hypothetical protein
MRSMQNPRSVLLPRELQLPRPLYPHHRSSTRWTQSKPPHSHRHVTWRPRSPPTLLNHQHPQTNQRQIPSILENRITTPLGRKPPVTLYIYKYLVKKNTFIIIFVLFHYLFKYFSYFVAKFYFFSSFYAVILTCSSYMYLYYD